MTIESDFRPAWWLPGPHLQTLWSRLHRRDLTPYSHRERMELPDGDFVDLDWGKGEAAMPLVLILHGLEGSSASPYARGLTAALSGAGMQAVVMHFRGCSGEPNRLPRSYHSGETGDLDLVARRLQSRFPGRKLGAVGFSLGGNVLLKWLGEQEQEVPLACAAAVSVPFVLAAAADRLDRGFSRLYRWALLRGLRASVRRKQPLISLPLAIEELARLTTFRLFDEHVTAPLHGFAGADDYYARSSSRQYLKRIAIPTLLLQALDDPFLHASALPGAGELSSAVRLELSSHGGHVGFIGGRWPWRAEYWLEQRLSTYFQERIK